MQSSKRLSDRMRTHQHAGVEFLYVISGKLAFPIGEDEPELVGRRRNLL